MPRSQYVKDLVDGLAVSGKPNSEFQRLMDTAVPYVAQMQEAAGIDIIPDGEWRRKSYIGVIADICSGFEVSVREVNGERQTWHIVTDEISPVNQGLMAMEARFLKEHTSRQVKVALPSPYLLGERMWDPEASSKAYPTRRDFTEALVPVLRAELVALRDEGVAIAQFDDPELCLFVDPEIRASRPDPDGEVEYCVGLLNRVVEGIEGVRTALHLCRRNKGTRRLDRKRRLRAHPPGAARARLRHRHAGVRHARGGRQEDSPRPARAHEHRPGMRGLSQRSHRHPGGDRA